MLWLYVLAAALSTAWLRRRQKTHRIPAVNGSDGLIASYRTALIFLRNAPDVLEQGYYQFPNGVFRVPTLMRWDYVANGAARISEVAAAPEDLLSFHQGIGDNIESDFTMGEPITRNPYHGHAIRGGLTRNLARCFLEVSDELVCAFDEVLALEDEWKLVPVLPSMMQIVARVSNRLLVGLPLCRDQEYLNFNINYTINIFLRGRLIALLPDVLKPILSPFIAARNTLMNRMLKFVGPMIEERLRNENEFGSEWEDKPVDLLSWLLELAEGPERTPPALALRMLAVNMAALHSTSSALTSALYDLTTYPNHIEPMRAEAKRAVQQEGWTKAAINNMHMIDSFLRESQRLNGSKLIALPRKVVAKEGFTFSDGTNVPYGAILGVSGRVVHYDPANYENAAVFDGFRFSRVREGEGGPARPMVATGVDHLSFGHEPNACPGRFFAAMELKAMLAHILIHYDVRAEQEGVRPRDTMIGLHISPSRKGKIWMRKRI
ncbi:cytochrome P450 [Mycena capillaripes]|nr:cytochrome P450 [Mycena capillaripes]